MAGEVGAAEDSSDVATVRAGEELDWTALEAYLRAELPELAGDFEVSQFPHGSANLTYRVRFGARFLVVRRPPFGTLAPGAHDMVREFRTLSRLYQCYDRAPRALLLCQDHDVVGSDFLVSEYRSGVIVWNGLPDSLRSVPGAGGAIGSAVVDALADLHSVDPAACGLETLGRAEGFLRRQLDGWTSRWELTDTGEDGGLTARLGKMLRDTAPGSTRATDAPPGGMLHNDFKIDNCQFAPGHPERVTAVFDWDMATLGDSLVDVGTMLNYWPDPDDPPESPALFKPGLEQIGLPSRSEVVDRYVRARAERGTDIDPGRIRWYEAFACWKSAVILQQLYARYVRGQTTDPRMRERGTKVALQARRGMRLLGRDRDVA